jgi:hypothetical protein
MAAQNRAKASQNVEAARRIYLGVVFLRHYPPDIGGIIEPQVEILPEIIAANCLGITYGDPGPKLPSGRDCRECWGERYMWMGNTWGMSHKSAVPGQGGLFGCSHECHEGEVWQA